MTCLVNILLQSPGQAMLRAVLDQFNSVVERLSLSIRRSPNDGLCLAWASLGNLPPLTTSTREECGKMWVPLGLNL